jgi:type 1 glutamine amidotransferase
MTPARRAAAVEPRVLLLHGGWKGHQPDRCADFAARHLLPGCHVTRSGDLGLLRMEVLTEFDLLLPIWTFGELTDQQVDALLGAVAGGLGMVAWHGAASSFLNSRSHKFLLGGQFVGHPGGDELRYRVRFLDNDPLVRGLPDFDVVSEQYYLLVDPAVKVLARAPVHGGEFAWLAGVEMPVARKRRWGAGRVFYCALGHAPEVLALPPVTTLLSRAIRWAVRGSAEAEEASPR